MRAVGIFLALAFAGPRSAAILPHLKENLVDPQAVDPLYTRSAVELPRASENFRRLPDGPERFRRLRLPKASEGF